MNIHKLQSKPSPKLAEALEQFELQFRYPLGSDRTFRISHGSDYPRFFRSIGEAACFVGERNNQILGVIGAAIRTLRTPDGSDRAVAYFGDVKVDPAARNGRVYLRLARAAHDWAAARTDAAFGIVMGGTRASPGDYTGRLGFPLFTELGQIAVLRLGSSVQTGLAAPSADGTQLYLSHSAGRFACPVNDRTERTEIEPFWLATADNRACGLLEDTRRAKRLFADNGEEILSAHLSCFAYQDVQSGVELLKAAAVRASSLGLPAVFLAVPASVADGLVGSLVGCEVTVAPATVYGVGLESGRLWNINTAEI